MKHPVVIHRSKRKTMSLSIGPDLRAVVRAPLFVSSAEIEAFVEKHEQWIGRQTELQRERAEKQRALLSTPEKAAALKERAAEVLSERVRHYGAAMGVHPAGIRITSARTRWGSCSAANRLCFSYRLILLPPEAVDAVVVHELAHIRVKNHGPAFYREVETYLPDYRRRIALLKAAQREIGL